MRRRMEGGKSSRSSNPIGKKLVPASRKKKILVSCDYLNRKSNRTKMHKIFGSVRILIWFFGSVLTPIPLVFVKFYYQIAKFDGTW